ncbi:signal transduction histidine-protein kinase/phosphatase UhpB [Dongshaea marina]|uniref:signal transduction histidine-protein kinase/phosphatase UhpB n=1 Tax=Dongshaea marina TaxID=2047966 RepID=UPI00131F31EF|nr:signal transduction histidine-protein kinase/phosphatase UhpB [Dongshaea marina]
MPLYKRSRCGFTALPLGLLLAILLNSPSGYRPTILLAHLLCLLVILDATSTQDQLLPLTVITIGSFGISLLIDLTRKRYSKPLAMTVAILLQSLVSWLVWSFFNPGSLLTENLLSLIAPATSATLLLPLVYLIQLYLTTQKWHPKRPTSAQPELRLNPRHLLLFTALFVLNICCQLLLPEHLERLRLIIMMAPLIFLAFRFGWQGASVIGLLNAVVLSISEHYSSLPLSSTDILLAMLVQSLMGLGIGFGISCQRTLTHKLWQTNQALEEELGRNQRLTSQLIHSEEAVRHEIARELHDEIGQNITAIRTQAMIMERSNPPAAIAASLGQLQETALGIYDCTHQLLYKLRPQILDELGLKPAVEQLFNRLGLNQLGIEIQLDWQLQPQRLSKTQEITVYRIIQEALNNSVKYASPAWIKIHLHQQQQQLRLAICDDGPGIDLQQATAGRGLQGIRERLEALGGSLSIENSRGTQLFVRLPLD